MSVGPRPPCLDRPAHLLDPTYHGASSGRRRLVRRIPSCRRCRIRGSARWGGRGTSVRENKVSVRVWRRKEGTGEMHGEPDGDVGALRGSLYSRSIARRRRT